MLHRACTSIGFTTQSAGLWLVPTAIRPRLTKSYSVSENTTVSGAEKPTQPWCQSPATAREMLQVLYDQPEYDCVAAYQESRKEGALMGIVKRCFYECQFMQDLFT